MLWDSSLIGGGDREGQPFYDILSVRTVSVGGWQVGNPPGLHPLEVGAWRASSVNTNTFARESHMDLLAAKAGADPPAFRLTRLVVRSHSARARCRGQAVRLTTGHVQVKRLVSALDVGMALNPDSMRQQIEGSITLGLGYALSEEVRFKDDAVLERNFDTYSIPRFSRLPKIETVLVDDPAPSAALRWRTTDYYHGRRAGQCHLR